MMKKLLLYLTLLCIPMSIFAQTFTQGILTYTVTSSTDVSVRMKNNYIYIAVIPASVTYLGNTYSVTSIEPAAFANCSDLISLTIPSSVTSIGSSAFSFCTALPSITIPDSVTSIGMSAFFYCNSLTSITLSNSITTIELGTFHYCGLLNAIVIPNSVTSIESCAFQYCSALTSATIGNSVTSIGDNAFDGCSALTSITLGKSVTSIEYNAFGYCRALISVTAQNPTPVNISAYAFDGVNITKIPLIVPAGKELDYENAAVWTDFMSITGATLDTPSFGKQEKVLVYPNPSAGIFNIRSKENTTLEVFDISGKKVKSQKTNGEISQVDLSEFTNGVYFLKTNKSTAKLMKNRL